MAEGQRRLSAQFPLAVAVALPGVYLGAAAYLGWPHTELAAPLAALVFGIAIIGAAFVLSWAAEAAQVDISAGLAIALLAYSSASTRSCSCSGSRRWPASPPS
ncbi:MAG: hypothetical protein ACRDSF_07755 [Pseudonocardiaceae bacterium]